MIDDSQPWKEDLARIAARLRGRTGQTRWTDRTGFLIERDLMVGGYAVRKLLDDHKLSDELEVSTVPAERFMLNGKVPGVLDRWELGDYYDMPNGTTTQLSLREFTNQIIHSWIWMLSVEEDPPHLFNGVFVSSDRERKRSLYLISADAIVSTFNAVASDDIVTKEYGWVDGEMRVVRKVSGEAANNAWRPAN